MAIMNMRVDISEQMDDIPRVGIEAIERVMELVALELWGQVRAEAPVNHGRLAGSFTLDRLSPLAHRVATEAEYAWYVHEGTPPHEIFPKYKQALWWQGALHPVRKVNHPGTQPNPYADRAIDTTAGRVDEFAKRAVDEVMARYDL